MYDTSTDTLTIGALQHVLDVLSDNHFPSSNWHKLGVRLGLSYDTLTSIEANYSRDVDRCFYECLAVWLKSTTKATWTGLANATSKIGEESVASHISEIIF